MVKYTTQERTKAAALFAEGASCHKVAQLLFKNNWAKAKKLLVEFQGDDAAPAEAAAAEDSGIWQIQLNVPDNQLDAIFATFSQAEKSVAIQGIMQTRLDAALGLEEA